MTYIKSKYFVRPIVLNWTVGILVVTRIFLSEYIPQEARQTLETILTCIYMILFLLASFYLFFKSLREWDILKQIEELEEEKEIRLKYFDNFDKEKLLLMYKKMHEEISDRNQFIHLIKTKEEFTNMSNIGNYFMVLLVLFVGQFSFDYLKPGGPAIFIVMILVCIIFCIRIIVWEGLERKNFVSAITIGHALAVYLLFAWGKNSYIRSYGDEILGSYFEKSEYKTQYYVNVFPDDEDSKNYRLPADIHVYSETEEGETSEDRFGQEHTETYTNKYIILDKAFWPNGGYLDFHDCQVEIGDKVLCSDQDGRNWYIELTNEKVR
jgi:hypothetical protein